MESGRENRSRMKRHVRAAKEWLGRAEDSLERSEDVRGDLNLMLARAELARAQETETPGVPVLWTRRVLPFAAALLIVGGGWLAWRPPARETRHSPPPSITQATETMPPIPAAVLPVGGLPKDAERGAVTEPLPLPPETAEAEEPERMAFREESAAETEEAGTAWETRPIAEATETQPITETAETHPITEETARVPSEEMQRLMNRAGQSLRAQ